MGIVNLKKRLYLFKDISLVDTLPTYNDALVKGIKSFQNRHSFNVDGKINASLIEELNIPVENEIGQIIINLYRMR